jgi:preprotein translocase subunit SecG
MFWTDVFIDILLVCYVVVSLLMCLIVLMQRSKQEGLGAAFGGGFTESVWGAQTSQVLVKATVILALLFFTISIILARLYSHREAVTGHVSTLDQELLKPVPAIVTNAAPAMPAAPGTPAAPVTNAAPVTPAAK